MLRHRGVGVSATKKSTLFMLAIGLALFVIAGAIAARGSSPLGQDIATPAGSPKPAVATNRASAAQASAAKASGASASSAKAASAAKSGSAASAAHVSAASSASASSSSAVASEDEADDSSDEPASSGLNDDSGRVAARSSGGRHALTYGYIKGRKFHDLNVNGVRDSGEPYLEGWTIKAYKDTDGDGVKDANETTVSDSDSTDSNGYYFLTLLAGKYVVCETQQSGWTQSAPANTKCGTNSGGWALTVVVDQKHENKDFGNYKKGKVSGEKFLDEDANGQEGEGWREPGLSGWTINAYVDTNGNGVKDPTETTVAASDVTDSIGDYELYLNPGKYIICEVQQTNWVQSVPSNSVCGPGAGGYAVTIASGGAQSVRMGDRHVFTGSGFTEKDFGNYKKTGKTGKKFHDLNADGDKDSNEPYLAGWTINAYVDSNGDGDKDAGENTIAGSAVTDANGEFTIYLPTGKYLLCEVQQAGWSQSAPANNVCGAGIGGYAVTISGSGASSIRSGGRGVFTGTHTNYEFGNYRNATKSGMKFHDLNANGAKDAGEPGLAGWTITAYKDSNSNGIKDAGETSVGASAVTDANGNYSMSLKPGRYVVCETQQATWTQSYPSGNICGNGGGWAINLAAGDTDTGNDFGNYKKATKSGTKFHDLNANGVKDQGEAGLPGWVIRAYADTNGDGTLQAGETTIAASATTAADGSYSMSLNPGKYVVCEVAQAGWTQSFPANTKCSAIAGLAPGGYGISLASGDVDSGNDFGNFQKGTKSGMKFNDLNGNGAKDQGEPGLAGWTITAYADANGNGIRDAGENTVAATQVTGAGGTYSLSLDPGKYIVCETQQAGWIQTYPANNVCGTGQGGWAITLTSGQTHANNDFGN